MCGGGGVGNYIVIQKQYRYDKAQKVCKEWYGTSLASIYDDNQNREVRKACQRVGGTGHCWIGRYYVLEPVACSMCHVHVSSLCVVTFVTLNLKSLNHFTF